MDRNSFLYSNQKNLADELGKIETNRSYHFISEGRWSMYQLLTYLLNITGPAKVWVTSFSISESALRSFLKTNQAGMIKELHCLFDNACKKNKLDLLYFANNIVSEIRLTANHSKLILIENEQWNVVVNGSANMSPNIRIEAGVICTDREIYEQYKQRVLQAFRDATLFKP